MKLVNEVLRNHTLAMPGRHIKVDNWGYLNAEGEDIEALKRVGFREVKEVKEAIKEDLIEVCDSEVRSDIKTFKRRKK